MIEDREHHNKHCGNHDHADCQHHAHARAHAATIAVDAPPAIQSYTHSPSCGHDHHHHHLTHTQAATAQRTENVYDQGAINKFRQYVQSSAASAAAESFIIVNFSRKSLQQVRPVSLTACPIFTRIRAMFPLTHVSLPLFLITIPFSCQTGDGHFSPIGGYHRATDR